MMITTTVNNNQQGGFMKEEMLSMQQAAEYLTISVSTMKRILAAKSIPYFKVGRSVRIKMTDLEQFLNARKVTTQTA